MSSKMYTAIAFGFFLFVYTLKTLIPVALTADRYTAEVVKPVELGKLEGGTAEFLVVKPLEGNMWNVDDVTKTLKLKVEDILKVGFYWENNQDRFDLLEQGDKICMTDYWWRSYWWKTHPIAVSYTEGACKE